jgi:transposase
MSKNVQETYNSNRYNYILYNKYYLRIIKGMRYTIAMFNKDFPNDDVCLDTIFQNRYGDVTICPKCGVVDTKFYRVTGRKCYACMHCGYQLHPLAQTIFHKSDTPLKSWFYAMYLFSVSKNGVSAKELERHLGVTYKTAHRMARLIRQLMQQEKGGDKFDGIIEADEAYIGGKRSPKKRFTNKTAVMGLIERNGEARAIAAPTATSHLTRRLLLDNVKTGAMVHTDESRLYFTIHNYFQHEIVKHAKDEYVRGNVHTNTIEGFWGQLKRSIDGTYHCVSPKYLQTYVNEFVFRYNLRDGAVYPVLLEQASRRVSVVV